MRLLLVQVKVTPVLSWRLDSQMYLPLISTLKIHKHKTDFRIRICLIFNETGFSKKWILKTNFEIALTNYRSTHIFKRDPLSLQVKRVAFANLPWPVWAKWRNSSLKILNLVFYYRMIIRLTLCLRIVKYESLRINALPSLIITFTLNRYV